MEVAALLLAASLPASSASLPKDALQLPLVRQATDYSCGAAALLSVLYYWGAFDGRESELYQELGTTPKDGTEPAGLVRVARAHGLSAELKQGLTREDLRRALARGQTVILDIQAWRAPKSTASWADDWDDGHYVVLAGLDAANAYLMDPSVAARYGWLPLDELEARWHDFEDRHGRVRRYVRAGIVVAGKKPAARREPERVE